MVPQKAWWGAGQESAAQRASFTTPATSSSALGPPNKVVVFVPAPGPRGPGHLRPGSSSVHHFVSGTSLSHLFSAPLKATSGNTCCGTRSPTAAPPPGSSTPSAALALAFLRQGPRAGEGEECPPRATPDPDSVCPAPAAPGTRPPAAAVPPSPSARVSPTSGCTPRPRKPELNSGTSSAHLHGTSSRKSPHTPVFRRGTSPARPAPSAPASPRPLTMMRGAPPSPPRQALALRDRPPARRDTEPSGSTTPAGQPYIARGRSARRAGAGRGGPGRGSRRRRGESKPETDCAREEAAAQRPAGPRRTCVL